MSNLKWRTLLIYGSFNDSVTGKNFFIVRIPQGRVPWSRKIAPAINQLVRSFFTAEQIRQDRARARGRESEIHWNCEGDEEQDGKSLWDLQQAVSRYEWDGAKLICYRKENND